MSQNQPGHSQAGFAHDIHYASLTATHPKEQLCGDACLVAECQDGLLAVVVDGLGHGSAAHHASLAALEAVHAQLTESQELPSLSQLYSSCHEALKETRGAALGLLGLKRDQAQFLSVGNIRLRMIGPQKADFLCQPGIVGRRRVRPQIQSFDWLPSHLLLMFSDGLKAQFPAPRTNAAPRHIAEAVLESARVIRDDASIIVLKRVG